MQAILVPTSLSAPLSIIELGKDELSTFHKYIECDCIDVVTLYLDDKRQVDCVIDDAGLLKQSPVNEYFERAYYGGGANYKLVGNVIICMSNRATGDTCKLDVDFVNAVLTELYNFKENELTF